MELYYNPEQMPDSEIKQTFVARQWLIDELLSLLKRQPTGAGTQHSVIIGPRGIGKTTVLLMFRLGIIESELGKRWFPVRFPEESYSIYREHVREADIESFDGLMTNLGNDFYISFDSKRTAYQFSCKLLRDWWLRHYGMEV